MARESHTRDPQELELVMAIVLGPIALSAAFRITPSDCQPLFVFTKTAKGLPYAAT